MLVLLDGHTKPPRLRRERDVQRSLAFSAFGEVGAFGILDVEIGILPMLEKVTVVEELKMQLPRGVTPGSSV